jgi:hypothetical protein
MTTERSGMSLSDKDKATLRELSELYKSEGWGSPDYAEWTRLTHPYSVDLLLNEIESLKSNLSRDVVVSDTQLDEWVARHALGGMCRTDLRAAYEDAQSFAARHAVVPDGYVLVPVEPTEAMCDAGGEIEVPSNAYHHSDIALGYEKAAEVYKAMLAQRDGGTK